MALKGLSELVTKIRNDANLSTDDIQAELNNILPSEWVPKSKFNETSEKLKTAETAKRETDALMKTLQEKAGLSDEYQQQIKTLKDQQTQAEKDFNAKLSKMKLDSAIEKALTGAKAKNPSQCARLLDVEKLTMNEDGTVKGLKEQIDALAKDSAYMFDSEANEGQKPGGNPPTLGGGRSQGSPSPTLDNLRGIFGLGTKKD